MSHECGKGGVSSGKRVAEFAGTEDPGLTKNTPAGLSWARERTHCTCAFAYIEQAVDCHFHEAHPQYITKQEPIWHATNRHPKDITTMTGPERIKAVLRGEPADHLPIQPLVMVFAAKHAAVPFGAYCRDGRLMAEVQLKFAHDFNVDVLTTCSDPAREVVDIAGEGSVVWFDDQPPAIAEDNAALADKGRLETFRIPDLAKPGRMNDRIRAIDIMVKEAIGQKSICGWVEGPLALAAELRGINNIMTDFTDDPEFVLRLLEFTADVAIAYGKEQARHGVDTIAMSDAAASLIGPRFYRQFLLPQQRRVLTALRGYGVITRLHMCGQTDALIADMKTLPVDIFELDFPVNLARARETLGRDKAILGNVSTISELMNGTPESVTASAERCHKTCGRYHVVGAGCEVSPKTPPENLRALVKYGIDHTP
ncbi:MAG TPA: uroporphyrinogen decarboxylase family protein [Capsulimonadaceae bacterium]